MKRHNEAAFERQAKEKKYESAFNTITTPEIICDAFSFLDIDQIERIQLVNKLWNNIIIRHKNIFPHRQLYTLKFLYNQIYLYATEEEYSEHFESYQIETSYIKRNSWINLSKGNIRKRMSSRYSQLTVDEVLNNLNNVVFDSIQIYHCHSKSNFLLDLIKLVTTKTGGSFRGRFGFIDEEIFSSKLYEIFENYIIVDKLKLVGMCTANSYIREVCANPEIVQLPSTPKEIRLSYFEFQENEEVLNFTCNGKLNGANRLTIKFLTSKTNYGNFIRQWFKLYRTHENPISLVGKFELRTYNDDSVLDAVKTLLNNTQLRVKYSLETKESHRFFYGFTNQYLNRRCVLHETDSYALVIEMAYDVETDIKSVNASDLDQPPCNKMEIISLCVKSL